jgi:hypothetical protein
MASAGAEIRIPRLFSLFCGISVHQKRRILICLNRGRKLFFIEAIQNF